MLPWNIYASTVLDFLEGYIKSQSLVASGEGDWMKTGGFEGKDIFFPTFCFGSFCNVCNFSLGIYTLIINYITIATIYKALVDQVASAKHVTDAFICEIGTATGLQTHWED